MRKPLRRILATCAIGISVIAAATPPSSASPSSNQGLDPDSGGALFVPIEPCRILDTRKANAGPIAPNNRRNVQASGTANIGAQGGQATGCGIPNGAIAVEASITVVSPRANGFLRAAAGGTNPKATLLNFGPKGGSVTNTGAIPLSTPGTMVVQPFSSVATTVVVDLSGYFMPTTAPGRPSTATVYVPVESCRIADTRKAGGPVQANGSRTFRTVGSTGIGAQGGNTAGCGIPAGATSLKASVTAVEPIGNGFLRVGATGAAPPVATFLNFAKPGASMTNTGSLPLAADGRLDVRSFSSKRTHLAIDVVGYHLAATTATLPDSASVFNPVSPCRVADTRKSIHGKLPSGGHTSVNMNSPEQIAAQGGTVGGCGIPVSATAVETSFTVIDPAKPSFLRAGVWREWYSPDPTATVLNFAIPRQSISGTAPIQLLRYGIISVSSYASKPIDVTVDLTGYYSPAHLRLSTTEFWLESAISQEFYDDMDPVQRADKSNSFQLHAAGSKGPMTFSSTNVPTGLSLSSSGVLSGLLVGTLDKSFPITVRSASGVETTANLRLLSYCMQHGTHTSCYF